MPIESDLRDRFRSGGAPDARIDVDAVVRRARARRRPRVVAAATVGGLAAAALVTPLVLTGLPSGLGGATIASDEDAATLGAPDDAVRESGTAPVETPAAGSDVCGEPVRSVYADGTTQPITATVSSLEAEADGGAVATEVLLINTGDERVSGWTSTSPALTLARDGVVMWHTHGPADARATAVDLAPGERLVLPAIFETVRCSAQDGAGEAFLPALAPGEYELRARVELTPADDEGAAPLVIASPPAVVRLN